MAIDSKTLPVGPRTVVRKSHDDGGLDDRYYNSRCRRPAVVELPGGDSWYYLRLSEAAASLGRQSTDGLANGSLPWH